MKRAIAHLKSVGPYAQSKYIEAKKGAETHAEFENNHWKERLHVGLDGNVLIPSQAFKNSLAEAAKYRSTPIPGKGKSTYTKHIEAGVACVADLNLGITPEQVEKLTLFVPSDGRRGGSSRVIKHFPTIRKWEGEVEFMVYDDVIDLDIFSSTLQDAGCFIGIGMSRPRNNGSFGRFEVVNIKWEEI